MQLERTDTGFRIDAVSLGPLLGVPAGDVQRLMREGRITSLHEEGRGEDSGRHRITFRHGATRVRLTVNDAGEVLLRTRTTVAPRPGTRARVAASGAPQPDPGSNAAPDDDPAGLTRQIEARFRARHRRQLTELCRLAEMVEDLHEGDEGAPAGLRRILGRMRRVLETHMLATESVVFPEIRRGATSGLGRSIEALRGDHASLKRDSARIREISRDFTPPQGACSSWTTLYAGLAEFIDAVAEHLRLESDVLFPRIDPGARPPSSTEGSTPR